MRLSYSKRAKFEQGEFNSPAMERFRAKKALPLSKAEPIEIEGDISFGYALIILVGLVSVGAITTTLLLLLDIVVTGQI